MAETKENKPVKLEAKVKANVTTGIIVAFAGHEYVKTEFRPVPDYPKYQAQARKHELLEVREVVKSAPDTKPEAESDPAPKPKEKK